MNFIFFPPLNTETIVLPVLSQTLTYYQLYFCWYFHWYLIAWHTHKKNNLFLQEWHNFWLRSALIQIQPSLNRTKQVNLQDLSILSYNQAMEVSFNPALTLWLFGLVVGILTIAAPRTQEKSWILRNLTTQQDGGVFLTEVQEQGSPLRWSCWKTNQQDTPKRLTMALAACTGCANRPWTTSRKLHNFSKSLNKYIPFYLFIFS